VVCSADPEALQWASPMLKASELLKGLNEISDLNCAEIILLNLLQMIVY
jgi:hypothetical protein